ncbi:MAG TPA: cytochrome C nitrite reductase, partial [Candidatus Dormibacteraeota bacterium]
MGLNMGTNRYVRIKTIELPGNPLLKFDIGWVDDQSRAYYLADRSNARVTVIDADRLEYSHGLAEGSFAGAAETGATSGPNGVAVLADRQEVWAGDGDSTLKVIEIGSRQLAATIATGGQKRVDELAYDPENGVVLAANDQEPVPFATITAVESREIVARVEFPRATNGLHQPVWDPSTRLFYVPVTEVDGNKATGEIAAVDASGRVVAEYPVSECQPAGLTTGPEGELCIACSKAAIVAGFAPRSLIMDLKTGEVIARVDEVGGTDEVWYNPSLGHYYFAAAAMVGGPVLGVVDAKARRWIENIPTAPDAHSVAA